MFTSGTDPLSGFILYKRLYTFKYTTLRQRGVRLMYGGGPEALVNKASWSYRNVPGN